MIEQFEFLSEVLLKHAQEMKDEARKEDSPYIKGRLVGEAMSYELCAKWIKEILEKPTD